MTLASWSEGGLSYRDALDSPCKSCSTTHCCNYLLLQSNFALRTLLDVDHAKYLLNFDGLIGGLSSSGIMEFYFMQELPLLGRG